MTPSLHLSCQTDAGFPQGSTVTALAVELLHGYEPLASVTKNSPSRAFCGSIDNSKVKVEVHGRVEGNPNLNLTLTPPALSGDFRCRFTVRHVGEDVIYGAFAHIELIEQHFEVDILD